MLRTMIESVQAQSQDAQLEDPISTLVQEIGAAGIVEEFRCQLKA